MTLLRYLLRLTDICFSLRVMDTMEGTMAFQLNQYYLIYGETVHFFKCPEPLLRAKQCPGYCRSFMQE